MYVEVAGLPSNKWKPVEKSRMFQKTKGSYDEGNLMIMQWV